VLLTTYPLISSYTHNGDDILQNIAGNTDYKFVREYLANISENNGKIDKISHLLTP
jgi:Mn-containing catalase